MKSDPQRRLMFRIAAMLGRWDVDKLHDEMTPEALVDWEAFQELEALNNERIEWLLAILCAQNSTRYGVYDFLYWREPPDGGEEAMKRLLVQAGEASREACQAARTTRQRPRSIPTRQR